MGSDAVIGLFLFGVLVVFPMLVALVLRPLVRRFRWRAVYRTLRRLGFKRRLFHLGASRSGWRLRFHLRDVQRAGDVYAGRFVIEIPVTRYAFRCVSRVGLLDKERWPGDPSPTGDLVFDARFGVFGQQVIAAAVLDPVGRSLLLDMPTDWVHLDRGIEALARRPLTAEATEGLIEQLVRLAEHLNRDVDPLAELVAQVAADPNPDVQAHRLGLLRSAFPNHSKTLEAARGVLAHPSPLVRLAAAQVLDDHATLQALATDRRLPAHVRNEALFHLVPNPESRPLVLSLLRDVELGPAPWRALAILGGPIGLDELPAPPPSHEPEMRIAAAACFALVGPPAEPVLLGFLADESLPVATAAAEALARAGTSRSIGPLRARLPRFPLSTTHLNRAITHTLAALGSRAQQHGGSLSLTEADGGGLSEPPTP